MNLRGARRMEGGRVRQSHGRYCDIPPNAPGIAAISVLLTRFPQHAIGRRHPRRIQPSAASVEEQVDDH